MDGDVRNLSYGYSGECDGQWCEALLGSGATGFDCIFGCWWYYPNAKTGYSTGDRVRIRASASTSSAVLAYVNRGDSFTVLGNKQNGWYKVTLKSGTTGYIYADYVTF